MRAIGIELSPSLLRTNALAIIEGAEEWAAEYGSGYVNLSDNIPVKEKNQNAMGSAFYGEFWQSLRSFHAVAIFCEQNANNIVIRMQTGKLSCSPEKELQIEKTVAFHIGELHRGFTAGTLDENLIRNMNETHFVINFGNGSILRFRGDSDLKYADVVSGGGGRA
ncbi:hypothetical protein PsorP6_009188 [Peronosclerospora sorghi]|uniref:Uncharacterized protein n=1 Tax=Peronosclerospora sorghi TaxID=230839 RepID=A0ACC0VZH6_9STRA|nr:hypothetical protein PsorP6_009188 [Peronosclerospora sorghi]